MSCEHKPLRGPIRVLAVDDHALLREGIAALVNAESDMKFVAEACNGREAVEKVRSNLCRYEFRNVFDKNTPRCRSGHANPSRRNLLEPRCAAVPSSFRLAPALDSRSVVAPYVSLYLGLVGFELPFRENLSEGSVLFVEYFFCSILEGMISNSGYGIELRFKSYRLP